MKLIACLSFILSLSLVGCAADPVAPPVDKEKQKQQRDRDFRELDKSTYPE